MSSSVRAVLIASVLLGSFLAPAAHAEDAAVKTRLDARGVKYEVDGDGDFKITYNYSKESAMDIAAETADDMEIEISGDRDAL